MTATKDRPLMVKHQAGPSRAYTAPAAAGPSAVATLNIEPLSATALGRYRSVVDQLVHESQSRRRVEGVGDTEQKRQDQDVPRAYERR